MVVTQYAAGIRDRNSEHRPSRRLDPIATAHAASFISQDLHRNSHIHHVSLRFHHRLLGGRSNQHSDLRTRNRVNRNSRVRLLPRLRADV